MAYVIMANSRTENLDAFLGLARQGDLDAIKSMLAKQPELLDQRNIYNETAILIATCWGWFHLVAYFINKGAQLDHAFNYPFHFRHGMTALCVAVERNRADIVTLLLDAGATQLLLRDNQQLIHLAAMFGHVSIIELFLTRNPELVNAVDDYNLSPFTVAVINNQTNAAICLLQKGARVDFIIFHPDDPSHGKMALNYAVDLGNIRIVHRILVTDYGLLKYPDSNLSLLMQLAQTKGHQDLTAYFEFIAEFLQENAFNFYKVDVRGKTIFERAVDNSCYAAASFILKMAVDQTKDVAAYLIASLKTAEHVFGLLSFDDSNAKFLLHDARINILIRRFREVSVVDSEQTTYIYKRDQLRRNPSVLAEMDKITGEVAIFKNFRKLGNGVFGEVYDFANYHGEHRAVKYPLPMWTNCPINSAEKEDNLNDYRRELSFQRRYHAGSFAFFYYERDFYKTLQYSLRSIRPYIPGVTLKDFVVHNQDRNQLILVFIFSIEQLIYLHQICKIIHGDLKQDNIMVFTQGTTVKVEYIDFGLSANVGDESYPGEFESIPEHLAPERRKPTNAKPEPNQDIYSFAYMWRNLFYNSKKQQTVYKQYPFINTWFFSALNPNPVHRPTLEALLGDLKPRYQRILEDEAREFMNKEDDEVSRVSSLSI